MDLKGHPGGNLLEQPAHMTPRCLLFTCRYMLAGGGGEVPMLSSVVHEPSGLEPESARVSWRLESLGGRRCCVGAVVARREQLHTEQEKIFTVVVDTWRVGISQQHLY